MSVVRGRGMTWSRYRRMLTYRRALTRTAVWAAQAGLPVVPGAWWSASRRRFDCDLPGCSRTGPHPAVGNDSNTGLPGLGEGLSSQALRQPEVVAARWRTHPYAVLVPTGDSVDVVDVPASLGWSLAARLEAGSTLGPVIAAGTRWFFLTAPGGQLAAGGGEVLVHGHGSWIMLPPSLGPGGTAATWLARPGRHGWALPSRDDVIRGFAGTGESVGLMVAGPSMQPAPVAATLPGPRLQVSPSPV